MSASVAPFSVSLPSVTPLTFTITTVPPTAVGNCTSPFVCKSASVSGASVAPNCTVLPSIAAMPAVEPTPW